MLYFIRKELYIKKQLNSEEALYLEMANVYANYVVHETFVYFKEMLEDLHSDNNVEYLQMIFPRFFVNRVGKESVLKRIEAIEDAITSGTLFLHELKPTDQFLIHYIVENFREDFENDLEDINRYDDKALLKFSVEFCRKDEKLIKAVNLVSEFYRKNKQVEWIELVYSNCCELIKLGDELLFDDTDFLPEQLDAIVNWYVWYGGNKDGIEKHMGVNLHEYTECMSDFTLEAFLKCQKKYEHDKVSDDGIKSYSEVETINNIYKAIISAQENSIFLGKGENTITDGIRDQLNMVYEVRDQSRCGKSLRGQEAGEVDLELMNDGIPFAKIEALKVDCLDKGYISSHIEKLLKQYDNVGCMFSILLIYYAGRDFGKFWEKIIKYVDREMEYPYKFVKVEQLEKFKHVNSRILRIELIREGVPIKMYCFGSLFA